MKKILSLLTAMALLMALAMPISAAELGIFSDEVQYSVTEEDETGRGLAFRFTVYASDVQIQGNRTFAGAKVTYNGEEVDLLRIGAVLTNKETIANDPLQMDLSDVDGKKVVNIEAKKLQDWDESYCAFAVRIINIPETQRKSYIYARPYFVISVDGQEQVVYDNTDHSNFYSVWCEANPVKLPAIGSDIDVTKQKNRIPVSAATIVERTVSLTFTNKTSNWITEETDYVQYTCYDANNTALVTRTIYIGCIDTKKNKSKTFTFEVPDATARVALTYSKITYWTEWT